MPQRDLFKRARDTLGEEDAGPDVQRWTVAWLSRAQQLRDERNKVVHSIVHNDGRPGWSGFHPRSRNMRRMETREIVELAEQAQQHVEEGLYRSVVDWPPVLGIETEEVDPDDAE